MKTKYLPESCHIGANIPPGINSELQRLSIEQGIPKSQLIRRALESFLSNQGVVNV